MTSRNVQNRDYVLGFRIFVLYRKGYRGSVLLGMSGSMAWCGIYRVENFSQIVSEVCNRVFTVSDQLRLGLCAMIFFSLDI